MAVVFIAWIRIVPNFSIPSIRYLKMMYKQHRLQFFVFILDIHSPDEYYSETNTKRVGEN